jgi:hypothetical protein
MPHVGPGPALTEGDQLAWSPCLGRTQPIIMSLSAIDA